MDQSFSMACPWKPSIHLPDIVKEMAVKVLKILMLHIVSRWGIFLCFSDLAFMDLTLLVLKAVYSSRSQSKLDMCDYITDWGYPCLVTVLNSCIKSNIWNFCKQFKFWNFTKYKTNCRAMFTKCGKFHLNQHNKETDIGWPINYDASANST